ncbi:SdrD B-like domain-containing protein [Lacrimispora sp.]|uniref:SdrD B-like domain-containing protein n=1 Tax=Lacrimispora sp. TaxID=2719234 RepID=UPI0028B12544|nr:SdrD B-like domain-containing protein [Lacrimispora sp.]
MRIKSSWRIALFLLLIGLLLTELLPITGIALNDSDNEVIVSFDMPVTEIVVPLGTETEDIPLPGTLTATLEGEGDNATDIPIIWEDSGLYNKEAAGTYLFTADIGTWTYAQARPVAIVTVVPSGIHISGKLWLDENEDGIKNAGETGIAGYPVTLFAEEDLNTPVLTTLTKADGSYRFESMEPGSYVVKVTSEIIGGTEYLLPLAIANDNNFAMDEEAAASWSAPLEIGEDAVVSGIDAGMRLPVGIMPLAIKEVSSFDELKNFLYGNQVQSGDIIVINNDIEFPVPLTITKNLNITIKAADGIDSVTLISANQRHFIISSDGDVGLTFENVILDGNGTGGGIVVTGDLVLMGAKITNCHGYDGGGVSSTGARSITLSNCEIYNNTAQNMGGGVSTINAQLTIEHCYIHDNSAMGTASGGGGVNFSQNPDTTGISFRMLNSEIYGNTSAFMGGGVLVAAVENSDIIGNKIYGNEGQNGGGIYIATFNNAVAAIDNNEIFGNKATQNGGGVYSWGVSSTSRTVITGGSNLENNSAADGGGIYANSSTVTIDDSSITDNKATNNGGGIYTTHLDKLSVSEEVTFGENTASNAARPLQNMTDLYPLIKTTSSSIHSHPLNNYDINVLIVTVHYIYGNGTAIAELPSVGYAAVSDTSFVLPPEVIPSITDYVFTGWRKGSLNGEWQDNTNVCLSNVTANTDIYLVYERSIVTVSQKVSGDYADKTKDFRFTIYFRDSNGPLAEGTRFQYTGGTVSGLEAEAEAPDEGMLTLEEGGKATFTLGHGQQISILAVPQNTVQIVESLESVDLNNYSVSFTDSITGPTNGSDTGRADLSEGDRTFDFINTRNNVVPAGVLIGNIYSPALLALSMFLLMGIISAGMIRSRRKRGLRYG